jgi:hypothetical protein
MSNLKKQVALETKTVDQTPNEDLHVNEGSMGSEPDFGYKWGTEPEDLIITVASADLR